MTTDHLPPNWIDALGDMIERAVARANEHHVALMRAMFPQLLVPSDDETPPVVEPPGEVWFDVAFGPGVRFYIAEDGRRRLEYNSAADEYAPSDLDLTDDDLERLRCWLLAPVAPLEPPSPKRPAALIVERQTAAGTWEQLDVMQLGAVAGHLTGGTAPLMARPEPDAPHAIIRARVETS